MRRRKNVLKKQAGAAIEVTTEGGNIVFSNEAVAKV
jgi:hypothetical protein